MKPKEKANKLVDKINIANKFINYDRGKTIALICVDEIINACEYNRVESYNTDWWEKVKIEINKL